MNKISFKFSSDYKVILIVNGTQTATSKYPSHYCFITLNELRENYEEECPEERCLSLMPYGDLRDDNNKFKIHGDDKKYAKECRSCISMFLHLAFRPAVGSDVTLSGNRSCRLAAGVYMNLRYLNIKYVFRTINWQNPDG